MFEAAAHQLLWAKTEKSGPGIHRLMYHMLDVGLSAELLWMRSLHPALKTKLARWGGQSIEGMGRWIAFLASLHDVGKASPAFQDHHRLAEKRKAPILAELGRAGLTFPAKVEMARHEAISTFALRSALQPGEGEGLLAEVTGVQPALATALAQALGGHHGAWPAPAAIAPEQLVPSSRGDRTWTPARRELVLVMWRIFQPTRWSEHQEDVTQDNVALMLLSAIVSAADWIGSNEHAFGYVAQPMSPEAYVEQYGLTHAADALAKVDWVPPDAMPPLDFADAFRFPPRQTQQQVISMLADAPLPALAILEAPMGIGKTEAALASFAEWARRQIAAGLYVAMPTTATSNQMHGRTAKFLARQIGPSAEPLLVHGQAALREADIPEPSNGDAEDRRATAEKQAWFLPRKKSLLAPYGVGTVDQALMAVLQTKHFFVRLLGLSHKVVIFDEVHAYDTYMNELFARLLQWLRVVDASVIVLSATLPEQTRQQLVAAYAGQPVELTQGEYPRLTTVAAGEKPQTTSLSAPETRNLRYAWLQQDVEADASGEGPHAEVSPEAKAIVVKLCVALASGGCAAVICNTVRRSQEVYQALRQLPEQLCLPEDLILFHARFPLAWRQEIEDKVISKFGPGPDEKTPNPKRPERAIIIATQVIEQSLDLDFDLMISELAPADLLLQRSGRLHRHKVNDGWRGGHNDCLWIVAPALTEGVPQLAAGDSKVYEPYVLLRTWLALQNRAPKIEIPREVPELIESVYGNTEVTVGDHLQSALAEAYNRMLLVDKKERAKAIKRRIPSPSYEDLLWEHSADLDEDNPAVNETFRALTRSDAPGVTVVCLHRVNGRICLEPDEPAIEISWDVGKNHRMITELARRTVSIRRPDIQRALLKEPEDAEAKSILANWREIAALRYHRLAIFQNGLCTLEDDRYQLHLDKHDQLGLQIV